MYRKTTKILINTQKKKAVHTLGVLQQQIDRKSLIFNESWQFKAPYRKFIFNLLSHAAFKSHLCQCSVRKRLLFISKSYEAGYKIELFVEHFVMLAMVADVQVARNRQLSLKMTSGYFVTANHCQCKWPLRLINKAFFFLFSFFTFVYIVAVCAQHRHTQTHLISSFSKVCFICF